MRAHRGRASFNPPKPYADHITSVAINFEIADKEFNADEPANISPEAGNSVNTPRKQPDNKMGIMVSLDHTIYFHSPREVKMDDWTFSEMETPWAGGGKGVVTQRVWNSNGKLVAICFEEVNQSRWKF